MINGAMLTCEEAQAAGGASLIEPEVCSVVQDEAMDVCGCFDPVCDICDGLSILNPNGVIVVNGSRLSCEEAQAVGNAELIAPDMCSTVQANAKSPCGCIDEDVTPSARSSIAPSAVPTVVTGRNIVLTPTTAPTTDPPISAAPRTFGMVGMLLLSLLTWVISL
jgi:hypothetical protein